MGARRGRRGAEGEDFLFLRYLVKGVEGLMDVEGELGEAELPEDSVVVLERGWVLREMLRGLEHGLDVGVFRSSPGRSRFEPRAWISAAILA